MKNFKLLFVSLLATCFSCSLFAQSNSYVSAPSGYNLVFKTNNVQQVSILTNGNILVNNFATGYKGLVTFDSLGVLHTLNYNNNASTVLTGNGTFVTMSSFSPWVISGSKVYYAGGNVGIGTTDPHYALQVVGDVVDSGNFFATNIATSNSISVGQFRLVDGIIDSIVSTSGTLQLSATVVNADGALTAAQTLTAGTTDTAITIDGHAGTITSALKTISFGNDTIATTGAIKAGNFQASYFKTDSLRVSTLMPTDSILYLGDPTPFLGIGAVNATISHQIAIDGRLPVPYSFWSSPNTGFAFVNSPTNLCPTFVSVGTLFPDAELNVTGPCNGNLLFSVTNNTIPGDVFTIDKNGNTFVAGTIGINTSTVPAGYSLAVNGAVIATDVYVELYSSWPDYVFDKNYHRRSLEDLETYLNINHHLPGMPSAAEVKDKGSISLGDIVTQNTKQIEELTLDLIELNKQVKILEEKNKELLEQLSKKK